MTRRVLSMVGVFFALAVLWAQGTIAAEKNEEQTKTATVIMGENVVILSIESGAVFVNGIAINPLLFFFT